MLKRIIIILVLLSPIAAPGNANPIADSAVSQLRDQGYNDIQVQRTLLGRIHITAISDSNRREMVIHPITGEIMRDRWWAVDDAANPPTPISIDPEGEDQGAASGEGGEEGEGGSGSGDGSGDSGDGSGGSGDGSGDGGGEDGDGGESGND